MNYKYLFASICLLISLWIYVFYRIEQTLINRMIIAITSPLFFKEARQLMQDALKLPNFIIYSLPEGLWVFAVTIISENLTIRFKKIQISIIYMPLVVAYFIELIQYLSWSKGTFDWLDVMVIMSFWTLGYIYVKNNDTSKTIKPKLIYVLLTYIMIVFSYVWK